MIERPTPADGPPPDDPPPAPSLRAAPRSAHWPAWASYALALTTTLATFMARSSLGDRSGEPLLELFLLPIFLSAYVGGPGPGLVAMAAAAALTLRLPGAPLGGDPRESSEWVMLLVSGALASWLVGDLRRSRGRAAASGQLMQITLASIGDAVITTDQGGRVTFLNAEAKRLTGWPGAEAIGRPLREVFAIFDEGTRAPVDDPAAAVLRTGQVTGLANHTVLRARDGRETPIDDSSAPICPPGGPISGVILVFRDISAQRRAEEELRASEARFHRALDSMLEGCQIIGFDWRYLYVNDSLLRHARLTRGELLGRTMMEVFPGIETTSLLATLRRCMEERRAERLENCCTYPDGSYAWFDLSVQPSPEGLFILSIEVTTRKEAESALVAERAQLAEMVAEATADLRVANVELANAARLKDEFLSTMSHELRTPLNAILGYAELLHDGSYGPVTSRQAAALQTIETSGRHLLELISDILDLSKIMAGKLLIASNVVEVAQLCRRSLEAVGRDALRRRIALGSSLDPQVVTLEGDERRLLQILVNLLTNAIKFTPEGGRVGLELRGDAAAETATFTVWDTGIGIAEADLASLFKPFTQIDSGLNRQYEGTGLGLALVQRLAQAHGGEVAVESAPGQGSRFSVTLPWAGPQARPRVPQDPPPTPI